MLGDTIAGALPSLRAEAESLMRATVTVTRVTGTTTVEGREVHLATTVYEGRARILGPTLAPGTADAAGRPTTIQKPRIHFPVGSFVMRVGDLTTVGANPDDPGMVDRRYRLTAEQPAGTLAVQYRVMAEEVL